MIPLKYTGQLTDYDRFVDEFGKKVLKWCKRGFIYMKNDPLDPVAKELLERLAKRIKRLANARPEELERIIGMLMRRYPDLGDKTKVLSKTVYRAFVGNGYDNKSFPKDELVRGVNVRVCPYCNRVFVESVKGRKGTVRGELDHFYPKEKYPFLAISRYNLVPSCPFCNGVAGKHSADPMDAATRIENPYLIKNHREMRFEVDIVKMGFLNLETTANAMTVRVDCSGNPRLEANRKMFNLDGLYNCHRDVAAEIYYKHLMTKSEAYKEFVGKMTGTVGRVDAMMLVWGAPIVEERLGSRPLGKFTRDVIDQLYKEQKGEI